MSRQETRTGRQQEQVLKHVCMRYFEYHDTLIYFRSEPTRCGGRRTGRITHHRPSPLFPLSPHLHLKMRCEGKKVKQPCYTQARTTTCTTMRRRTPRPKKSVSLRCTTTHTASSKVGDAQPPTGMGPTCIRDRRCRHIQRDCIHSSACSPSRCPA